MAAVAVNGCFRTVLLMTVFTSIQIIRYGSNDRKVSMENLREVVVVDKADNVAGLCHAGGSYDVTNDTIISASQELVGLVAKTVESHDLSHSKMICHNVEDYHAYNFTDFFDKRDNIHEQIDALEDDSHTPVSQAHCWDMETAALFWRAKQFGRHAATLLQNLLKMPGTSPYEGEHGKISLAMESKFYEVIFDTLCAFSPQELPQPEASTKTTSRALRHRSSLDYIGTDDPFSSFCSAEETDGDGPISSLCSVEEN